MGYNHVTYYRNEGSYDLCHPRDKQVQYYFQFGKWEDKAKELKIQRSFLIPNDSDNNFNMHDESPLELAEFIKDHYAGYWYSSSIAGSKKLYDFLCEIELENDIEYARYMKEKAANDLDKWTRILKQAEQDLREESHE